MDLPKNPPMTGTGVRINHEELEEMSKKYWSVLGEVTAECYKHGPFHRLMGPCWECVRECSVPIDRSVEWHLYKVDAEPDAPEDYIMAPSSGVAIEYYLACHGMLGYNEMSCVRVNVESKERVEELTLKGVGNLKTKMEELDKYHIWDEKGGWGMFHLRFKELMQVSRINPFIDHPKRLIRKMCYLNNNESFIDLWYNYNGE